MNWYDDLCEYYNVTPQQALELGTRKTGRRPFFPQSVTCQNPPQGLTFEEIDRLYPECSRYLRERNPDLRFPDGESLNELGKRVGKFTERLEEHKAEEAILIVVHSGVLRTLVCQLLGIELRHIYQFIPELASLSIMETYPGGAILNLFGDISHLDHLPPA